MRFPSQGGLLRITIPHFCLPYIPPPDLGLSGPPLSFKIGLSTMLCGSRELQTYILACPTLPSPSLAQVKPPLSFRIKFSMMLCGSRQRGTFTGSPALIYKITLWLALPSPPELGPCESPIVVQNLVVHHAVRFLSTQHVQRKACSE